MPKPVKPLALALAISFSLSASAGGRSIDPALLSKETGACGNLNTYVNAAWLAKNPVPADRTTWGTFETLSEQSLATQRAIVDENAKKQNTKGSLEQKIGTFYANGMDEKALNAAGAAPLKPYLAEIDAISDAAGLAAWLQSDFPQSQGFLFAIGGSPDFKNSEMMIAYASQSGLSLPEKAYYLEDKEDYKKIRAAFVEHAARMLALAGTAPEAAKKQAATVLAFETRLAKASLSPIELRDPTVYYNPVSPADADKITPHFSWPKLFKAQKLEQPKMFSLAQPGFFKEVEAMMTDTPVADWKAYLRYHTSTAAAPFLSDTMAEENFNFYGKTLRGQAEMKPRWKRTLDTVNNSMGEALGQLYVKKTFPPEAKQAALELVNNMRMALKARIEKLDWMSAETKKKALEKWSSFMPKIGYPDKWRSWEGLEIGTGSYLDNAMAAAAFNNRWQLDQIGKPVDKTLWQMTPQTINAYYNPQQNEIVFPAAILQPPFFDAQADPALNYGGIGAVIGHEMTHGYDDQGSKFDAKGNFENWWTDADKSGFEARTGQLVKQFDGYVALDDLHVKGELTLGENIADLGGLNIAYDALQKALADKPGYQGKTIDGFTQDQRFFMNWAVIWRRNYKPEEMKVRLNTDPHSPAAFRAIGAPSNMPAFAEAFGCKAGDPMVRAEDQRIVIW